MGDVVLFFSMGLLGSLHCVGMCGGFVLALAHGSPARLRFFRRQGLYYLGKTTTYAVLGALVGGGGQVLVASMTGAQQVLSGLVGVLLIGTGLALLGWLRMPAGRLGAGWRRLVGTMAAFLRDPTPGRIWALGLLNGLLPCGLVYAALAAATASGTALRGAFLMAVFGLATVPALLVLGSTGVLMRPAWRVCLQRAGAVLVILLGLLTLVRGFPSLHAGGHGQAAHDTPREHVH